MQPLQTSPSDRNDVKEQVRDAIDIVDLVGSYVALRRQGKAFVGLCPWHDDSKPSLQVNPERQTYRCWVCDLGGDAFNFFMRMEKVEFREALEQLADRAGIPLSRARGGQSSDERTALARCMEWAAARFRECLTGAPEAGPARAYLRDRGLAASLLERFGVGFAPDSWDWLLRQASAAGISAATLERAGLAIRRDDRPGQYDRFRGRVMFPIRDPLGRCIAFGGRILPGQQETAKYINSPETPLFSKSGTLYGLDTARTAMAASGRAVVVEGYTDCLAARQAGCDDVVAVLGTALGERHAKLLKRYADRVILVLDGDDAGRRRANEVLGVLLAEPIDLRIARLPAGLDPCDLLVSEGRDAFEQILAAAVDPLEYRMDEALAALPSDAGDDAALAAVESVLAALAAVRVAGSSERLLREDQVLGRLSRRFGLTREVLRRRLEEIRASSRPSRDGTSDSIAPAPAPRLPAWDREVLEVLVGVPEGAGLVVREVRSSDLESDTGRTVVEVARQLHDAGRSVSLSDLLLAMPDPAVQSILVSVDEANASRGTHDAGERLGEFAAALRRRAAGRVAKTSARALKTSRLDSVAEAELLERLVAQRRVAQGISEPKEG